MEVILLSKNLYAWPYSSVVDHQNDFIPVPDYTFQVITDPDPNPSPDPALKLGKLNNKQMYCTVYCSRFHAAEAYRRVTGTISVLADFSFLHWDFPYFPWVENSKILFVSYTNNSNAPKHSYPAMVPGLKMSQFLIWTRSGRMSFSSSSRIRTWTVQDKLQNSWGSYTWNCWGSFTWNSWDSFTWNSWGSITWNCWCSFTWNCSGSYTVYGTVGTPIHGTVGAPLHGTVVVPLYMDWVGLLYMELLGLLYMELLGLL